jgi:hypothetical protein
MNHDDGAIPRGDDLAGLAIPHDLRPSTLSVGRMFSRTFQVLRANLVSVYVLTGIAQLPTLLLLLQLVDRPMTLQEAQERSASISSLGLLLSYAIVGPITYIVFMHMRGTPAGVGAALLQGLKRFLPVLATTFLVGLVCFGGVFLLIIPAFIFFCMLYVAVPTVVVERSGIRGALKRSAVLTKGSKGTIFLFLLLEGIAGWLVLRVITAVLPGGTPAVIGIWAHMVVFGGFSAVAAAVAYHDLRVGMDGMDTAELARVFD